MPKHIKEKITDPIFDPIEEICSPLPESKNKKDQSIRRSHEIPWSECKEIKRRYLEGQDAKSLGKEFNTSTNSINVIVKTSNTTNIEIVKPEFTFDIAKENQRIAEIKDKFFTLIEVTLQEAMFVDEKFLFVPKFKGLLDVIDRIGRLNSGMSTENITSVQTKFDVAEVIKELNTPEDKKKFLLNQLENNLLTASSGKRGSKS